MIFKQAEQTIQAENTYTEYHAPQAEATKKHYEKAQEHNEQISKDLAMLEGERSSLSGEQEKKLKKAILTQQELEAFERSLGDFMSAFEGNTNDLASAQLLAMLSGAEAHYKYLVDSDLSSTADRLQKNVLDKAYAAMEQGDFESAERMISFSMIYDADHYGNPNLPEWLNDIRQGFAEGARESALSTDDAFAAFWNNPSAAANGLLNVIAHPMEASEALVEAFGDKWNELAEGTPKERARMAGSLFGEASQSMVVPGCVLGKLAKGAGLVDDVVRVGAKAKAATSITLSKAKFGHTFSVHGSEMSVFLSKRASGPGFPQGQFLDDQTAAKFIQDNLKKAKDGAITLSIFLSRTKRLLFAPMHYQLFEHQNDLADFHLFHHDFETNYTAAFVLESTWKQMNPTKMRLGHAKLQPLTVRRPQFHVILSARLFFPLIEHL